MSDKKSEDLTKPIVWLGAMYILGLVGLAFHETQEIFTRLIPLYLVITSGVLIYYQKHWNFRIIFFCLFTFFVGFLIEVVIIQTQLFSQGFRYGKVMGPKILNVPIVIGFLWLLVVYCSGVMVKNLKFHSFANAAIGAAMIVMLDVLLEPVAMKLGMWGWSQRRVPFMNYVVWFVASYGLLIWQLNLKANLRNELAPYVFCIIAGFFLAINLY